MNKAKVMIPAVVVALVLAIAGFFLFIYHGSRPYSSADQARLRAVVQSVRRSGTISDSDVDWSASLLQSPSTPALAKATVLAMFSATRNPSPTQRNTMFTATAAAVTGPDDTDPSGLVKAAGASTLARIGGQRAVPYLTPLLNNTTPAVRDSARRALGEVQGHPARIRLVLPA